MEADISRVIRKGGKGSGKVVGRYFIGEDARIELHLEKFEREFRHTVEFVLNHSAYKTMQDVMKLDYLTFFRVVNECEAREKETVDRLEKQSNG
jgi:hypothetical protein